MFVVRAGKEERALMERYLSDRLGLVLVEAQVELIGKKSDHRPELGNHV